MKSTNCSLEEANQPLVANYAAMKIVLLYCLCVILLVTQPTALIIIKNGFITSLTNVQHNLGNAMGLEVPIYKQLK